MWICDQCNANVSKQRTLLVGPSHCGLDHMTGSCFSLSNLSIRTEIQYFYAKSRGEENLLSLI